MQWLQRPFSSWARCIFAESAAVGSHLGARLCCDVVACTVPPDLADRPSQGLDVGNGCNENKEGSEIAIKVGR